MEEPAFRESLRALIGCVSSAGAARVGQSLQSPFWAPPPELSIFLSIFSLTRHQLMLFQIIHGVSGVESILRTLRCTHIYIFGNNGKPPIRSEFKRRWRVVSLDWTSWNTVSTVFVTVAKKPASVTRAKCDEFERRVDRRLDPFEGPGEAKDTQDHRFD